MARRARAEARRNLRYRWLTQLPRARARRLVGGGRLLVLSSRMEGGANVISEAVVDGTPVVASRIPGSVGLLGAGYPGYFPVGDTAALARRLRRAETDSRFYHRLRRGGGGRGPGRPLRPAPGGGGGRRQSGRNSCESSGQRELLEAFSSGKNRSIMPGRTPRRAPGTIRVRKRGGGVFVLKRLAAATALAIGSAAVIWGVSGAQTRPSPLTVNPFRGNPPATRSFEFDYVARIPALAADAGTLRVWIPVPETDPQQLISGVRIESPVPYVLHRDPEYRNQYAYLEITPEQARESFDVRLHFQALRREDRLAVADGGR